MHVKKTSVFAFIVSRAIQKSSENNEACNGIDVRHAPRRSKQYENPVG